MSLIAWIAKEMDLSESEASQLYDQREALGALVGAERALRAVALRIFNNHLETISSIEQRPNEFLAYKRGRAQEALEIPATLRSLHERLLTSCDHYREYLKQQEEQTNGPA